MFLFTAGKMYFQQYVFLVFVKMVEIVYFQIFNVPAHLYGKETLVKKVNKKSVLLSIMFGNYAHLYFVVDYTLVSVFFMALAILIIIVAIIDAFLCILVIKRRKLYVKDMLER